MIIDLDFEPLQADREINSLSQQLTYCTNINKQQKQPLNLIFTGIGPKLEELLARSNY